MARFFTSKPALFALGLLTFVIGDAAAPRRSRCMRLDAALALLCLALSCSNAEAGQRQRIARPCEAQAAAELKEARRVARGRYIADQLGFGGVADKPSRR